MGSMAANAEDTVKKENTDVEKKSLLDVEIKMEVIPLTFRQKVSRFCKENLFMILTLTGVAIGFIIGALVRVAYNRNQDNPEPLPMVVQVWLDMPGDLFIRLLKLTILPLIGANVIVVSASLDPKVNGKISLVSFGYIIVANVGSACIGCLSSLIIRPGASRQFGNGTDNKPTLAKITSSDVFADLLYNIFPDNLVGVTMFKTQTVYEKGMEQQLHEFQVDPISSSKNMTDFQLNRRSSNAYSVNMIGVIFCAAVFGMAARTLKDKGVPFIAFFQSLAHVVIKVMKWFLWLTPPGVCFMIAGSVAKVDSVGATMSKLALFIGTVTVGLGIHFIILQVVYIVVGRKNPLLFLPKTFQSWFISMATTAPVVAIPEMIECCDSHKFHPEVSRFVIPFAAAIKGDGSAVFIGAASIFCAQAVGFPINAGTVIAIILLVSSAMLALPNIPSASLVILVTILTSVGVDESTVALLYAIDWLLDRMRSGSIGLSHLYCAAFTHFICAKDIEHEAIEDKDANGGFSAGVDEPEKKPLEDEPVGDSKV